LGTIVILGGFYGAIELLGLKEIYFQKDQMDSFGSFFKLFYFFAAFTAMTVWFSLIEAFVCFLVLLLAFAVTNVFAKMGGAAFGLAIEPLHDLIKFSLVLLLLLFLSTYLVRGYRTRLTRFVLMYAIFSVLLFSFPFLPALDVIRTTLFPNWLSAEDFRSVCSYLISLAGIELVCWYAGKIEALPER
jgi:hypothetical protein